MNVKELSKKGVYNIYNWNCKSTRAFHQGEIDYYYRPSEDELYSDRLTIKIEHNLQNDGLIAIYQFRAAQFVRTPVANELKLLRAQGRSELKEDHNYSITVLRDLSLQNLFPFEMEIYNSLDSPFAALKALENLYNKLNYPA